MTYGTTELGSTTSPGPDSHFRIGSVTKTMTAAVILQLAQDGALRLDDSVAKYRPDVPGGADITIGQLLNMRSGLYNYTADADFWPALERESTKEWTPEELLAIAFGHEHRGPGSFLIPRDFTDLNPSWAWAAGGVISTATDLATWIEAPVSQFLRGAVRPAALGRFRCQ